MDPRPVRQAPRPRGERLSGRTLAEPRDDRALLVLSQVYVPDPASVGQHLADVVAEMARRGRRVVVVTSDRGYEDPSRRYPRREEKGSVLVLRLPASSLGKATLAARLLGAAAFLVQATLRSLFVPRLGAVLVSTSPPMAAAAGLLVATLRRVPLVYWVMDLNPDQAVALGHFRSGSLPVRALDLLNRAVLARADEVVALDRFMAERLAAKGPVSGRLLVSPPWPHDEHLEPVGHEENPFRARHGLTGKRVVEYSGNHSPSHPLATLLEAARSLEACEDLVFLFVGGGASKKEVDQLAASGRAPNVRSLPYQPLEELRYSLSAADVHVVSMGNDMVGIVHPCKIYGALAVGRPVLLIGPRDSHAGEIVEPHGVGWRVDHGDVAGMVSLLTRIRALPAAELEAMGKRARALARERFDSRRLCGRVCDVLDGALTERTTRRGAHATGRAPSEAASGMIRSGECVADQRSRCARDEMSSHDVPLTPDGYRLGDRDHGGIAMMAGYTSAAIHGKAMILLEGRVPAGGRVLDVGAGHGSFSNRLRRAGYEVAALEGFADFQAEGIPCLRLDLNGDWAATLDAPFDRCDAVVALEILEHLENPFHFLRQARRVLRPGGFVLLSSPNAEATLSRWTFLLWGRLPLLEHEDHRTPILRTTVERLCREVGFELVERDHDVDLLDMWRNPAKGLAKKLIKHATRLMTRDRRGLEGLSNLWLLRRVERPES